MRKLNASIKLQNALLKVRYNNHISNEWLYNLLRDKLEEINCQLDEIYIIHKEPDDIYPSGKGY